MRTRSLRSALLASAIVFAVGVSAHAADPVDLDSAPGSAWVGEQHYGIFRGEKRIGWMMRSLSRMERQGVAAAERRVETFVDVAGPTTQATRQARDANLRTLEQVVEVHEL